VLPPPCIGAFRAPPEDAFRALPDEVVLKIFNCVAPDLRLELGSVSPRFACLLRRGAAFAVLDFSSSGDAALAALCARAGPALRVLDTTGNCCAVSGLGVAEALSSGGAGSQLVSLSTCAFADASAAGVGFLRSLPLAHNPLVALFSPAELFRVLAACPQLQHASVGAMADAAAAVQVLQLLALLPPRGRTALCVRLSSRASQDHCHTAAFCQRLAGDTRLRALAFLRVGRNPLTPAPPRTARFDDSDSEEEEELYYDDEPFASATTLGLVLCAAVTRALSVNTTLEALDLAYNGVGDQGCALLALALRAPGGVHDVLRELHLEHNGITTIGASQLGIALKGNHTLRKLGLGGNPLGGAGCAMLAQALEAGRSNNNGSLRVLSLYSVLPDSSEARGLVLAAARLASHPALTTLDLRSNAIEDVSLLAPALAASTALRELDLSGNSLAPSGLAALVRALGINRTLEKLSLRPGMMQLMMSMRGVGPAAGGPPAAEWTVLQRNASLRELELRCMLRSEAEAAGVAVALVGNTALRRLDVGGCHFAGERVTRALRAALQHPSFALVTLEMARNALSADDVTRLADGLACNTVLRSLELSQCGVCARGAAALAQALHRNTALISLVLLQNNVGDRGAAAFAAALAANNGCCACWRFSARCRSGSSTCTPSCTPPCRTASALRRRRSCALPPRDAACCWAVPEPAAAAAICKLEAQDAHAPPPRRTHASLSNKEPPFAQRLGARTH
jgi:Ran GTPase-activating protein (RanGAP) involved in mRNA processing and transport